MENKDYIVAVDLGDSNIVVAVGSAAPNGLINIEYISSMPSRGVNSGKIENIELAIGSIKTALAELKDKTGIDAKEVYAGISGEFIQCSSHTDHVFVPDHKNGVTQQVVDALFERMKNVMVSEDRVIMDRIPQRYVINDTTEVDNPVGVFGSPLSSTFNFIASDKDLFSRLDMALRRLGITPRRIFSNAVVVGDAVLTPDEMEEGVVVVDIGGGLTDVAIYHRNVLRYISTIPIGAKAINSDIRTMTIPERYIEPLKLRYGCALSKNAPQDLKVLIKGRSRHDQREIAVYNLAAVIEARARDIAELVSREIADSEFADKVPYGIVLTGGSAQLRGLDELFREVTGLDVRVAEAEDVITPATCANITSSADSTVVGLLLHGLKYGPCDVVLGEPKVIKERIIMNDPPEPKNEVVNPAPEQEVATSTPPQEPERRVEVEKLPEESVVPPVVVSVPPETPSVAPVTPTVAPSVPPVIPEPQVVTPKPRVVVTPPQPVPPVQNRVVVTPPEPPKVEAVTPKPQVDKRFEIDDDRSEQAPVSINSHLYDATPKQEQSSVRQEQPKAETLESLDNDEVNLEEDFTPKKQGGKRTIFSSLLSKISGYANKMTDGFDVKENDDDEVI